MPRQQLEIATGFYASDSLPLCAQRCINWIPVIPQAESLSQRALFDAPGLTLFSTVTGVNRGSKEMKEVPYFVNGNSLWSVNSAGVSTNRGTIEGSGRVSMATNGQYLVVVVPNGKAYAYDNVSSTLTQITDIDFTARKANAVVYKDGFFVFAAADGTVFFNSALNDPFTLRGEDFLAADINPDRIMGLHVNHNELYVLGSETIELFQTIGGADFPFQRIPGANIQKGVHGGFSVSEFDNTFTFVGGGVNEGSAIWKVTSSASAVKISTSAIDTAIQEFTRAEIENCFTWAYALDGNYFVGFTFESDRIPSKTFSYDATTSALAGISTWHERQSGTTDNSWRVNSIVYAHDKLLVGDSQGGNIGYIDKKSYTEYGDVMVQEKASKPFSANGIPLFAGEIQLTMESGVGLATGQGSDPVVRMDFSDDGGRTFSSEFSRSYGKIGEYMSLPTWRRQGRIPRHRVLRFKTSEPVKSVIIKLEANIAAGS
jgi:hypothetical protein